ncbi:MAG TPA: CapA family protein [Candidatus Binatia bacterium]|jgi:poly-gamma-glutamate synthesis protein (capsule biosynthesis protein)|nr:CapA family protein [Candidatus Binatia bacterium]
MIYAAEIGNFTIALAGDTMLTRKLTPFNEERFLALREILRGADAAFANLEGTVHTWDEGTPGITQGTFMTTEPKLLEDLQWFGINMVSCANNHAFDYGEGGVLANIKHLDEAGLVHAGTGKNLAEARAPGYLDTPNGRIALIATTATFRQWNQAGEQRPDLRGRPGINPLGFQTAYSVDAAAFAQLHRISHGLGFEKSNERARKHFYSDKEIPDAKSAELSLLGNRYVAGEGFSIATEANERDLQDNLRWIREARRQADWVVVSVHCHEFGGATLLTASSRADLEETADFVTKFAHQAIDEGADVLVGHGSHFPMGIEIYQGKPIFYSVGNFVFQNETVGFFPADAYERFGLDLKATPSDFLDARTNGGKKGHPSDPAYWENMFAVCQFSKNKLKEIRIHPIDQGFGRPRPQRGRPLLAEGQVADRVIERVIRLSARYGTKVLNRDGVGVIEL